MRRLVLLQLVLCLSSPAWGLAEYYSLSRSVRALGMGNAFYGNSDDEGALFYNPAGLARYDGGGQFFLSAQTYVGTDLLGSLSTVSNAVSAEDAAAIVSQITGLQGNFNSVGVTLLPFFLHRGFAIGALVGDVKGSAAFLGRDLDSEVDITAINDSGVFIGKGFSVGKQFRMGVTLKGLYRIGGRTTLTVLDIVQQTPFDTSSLGGSGGAFDVDWGMNMELTQPWVGDRMGFSLVMHNLFASSFGSGPNAPPGLVRSLSLGTYTQLKNRMGFRLDLAEFALGGESDPNLGARGGSFFKHVNFGWEMGLGKFALRAGIYQGNLTAGFGLELPFLRLDFATYAEELGQTPGNFTSRRLALRLAFGFGFVPRQPYLGGRG